MFSVSRINFDTDIGHYFYWYFSCMKHIMINVLTLGKLLSVYGLAKNIKDKRTWNKTFIGFGCCLCFGVWKIIWKYLPLRYTPIGSFHVFSLRHWVCVFVCVCHNFLIVEFYQKGNNGSKYLSVIILYIMFYFKYALSYSTTANVFLTRIFDVKAAGSSISASFNPIHVL